MTETRAFHPLCSVLSTAERDRILHRFGLGSRAEAAFKVLEQRRPVLLIAATERRSLGDILGEPCAAVVEVGHDGLVESVGGDWVVAPDADCGLVLSLTTASAYRLSCAPLLCEALERRGAMLSGRRAAIEACLQEAIANALMHGNLGIAKVPDGSIGSYQAFSRLVLERLQEQRRRMRRLEILAHWDDSRLEIAIADEGDGFDAARVRRSLDEVDPHSHSGRGFPMMRTLADALDVRDGGRCTLLRFLACP